MGRAEILSIVNQILANSGKPGVVDEDQPMREVGFRSLDFSEAALRIEGALNRELNFEASAMRRITTIKDVVDFFVDASKQNAAAW